MLLRTVRGTGAGLLTVINGGAGAFRQKGFADAGYEFSIRTGSTSPRVEFGAGATPVGRDARVAVDVRGIGGRSRARRPVASRFLIGVGGRVLVLSLGCRVPAAVRPLDAPVRTP